MTPQLFMEDRIHTELEAYLLGLFYADGSVSHFSYGAYRFFSISLKAEDKDFLQKICDIINKDLGTNYTIKFQEKTNSYKLTVCKKTFIQRLVLHGIIPHKTYSFDNSIFINLYDELKPHFIRGYFDGDGSIYITKENRAVLNIVSYNKNIIESIFIYYYTKFGVGSIKEEYSEKYNNYYYRFCLGGSVKAFRDFIYKNCTTIFMPRKREIFESITIHKTKNRYIGLSKYFNKIKVEISSNNKKYYLGLFSTVKEALEKYNEKAKILNKPIQIYKGKNYMNNNKNLSLIFKWLPSNNASSKTTKKYANIIRQYLGWSWQEYQQTLSAMRKELDIVERKMSSNNWQAIDYEHVPSRANLIYNDAFLRHDEERRRLYLDALTKGEAKINASTLFPHDIIHKYGHSKYDEALEQLWKNLPDYGIHDTLVVADGSGSMLSTISDTKVSALSVANALAIYCSEHNNGEFKNKYITFSNRPKFVKFNDNWTLRRKIAESYRHSEIADTNIEAVFDLILKTAINNNLSNDEMIKNILIISDMQFNSAVAGGAGRVNKALFDVIEERFNAHGYTMPKLIFWNVMNNRWYGHSTFPVTINQGFPCTLVSGFSVSILQMVMNGEINPYNALIKTLSHPHYDFAEDTLKRIYTGNGEF